jgi:hypothetical protein
MASIVRTIDALGGVIIDGTLEGDRLPCVINLWEGRGRVTYELEEPLEFPPVTRSGMGLVEFTRQSDGLREFQTSPRPVEEGMAAVVKTPMLDRIFYWPE